MTYFEDMSNYGYLGVDRLVPELGVEPFRTGNIGWLDDRHAITTGGVSTSFEQALDSLLRMRVRATRGLHRCQLCNSKTDYVQAGQRQTERWEDVDCVLGSAEIQVPTADGRWLIAPDLVVHYVRRHGYQPPSLFCQAVEDYAIVHPRRCQRIAECLNLPPETVIRHVRRPLGPEDLGYLTVWPKHESWTRVLELTNGLVLLDPYEGLTLWGREQYEEAELLGTAPWASQHGVVPICGEWPRFAGIRIEDGLVVFVDAGSDASKTVEILASNVGEYISKVVRTWQDDGALLGEEGRWQLLGGSRG